MTRSHVPEGFKSVSADMCNVPRWACVCTGGVALNCTASRGAVGRVCLAAHLQHSAAATNASRAATSAG